MATIKERGDKHVVIYDYKDGNGKRKQKWEQFDDLKEAKKFKARVEADKLNDNLFIPSAQKIGEFLVEWAEVYGKANWRSSTYSTSVGLVKNHIIPEIGHIEIQKITPKDIEMMLDRLSNKKVNTFSTVNLPEDEKPCLSGTTLRYVHLLTKQAFDKAVEWRLIKDNPVLVSAPARSESERSIWDADMIKIALDNIEHPQLHLAVHFAFVCSLRIGEVLGLTWDCIDFEKRQIKINKTLQRVSKEGLEKTRREEEVIRVFPEKKSNAKTVLALKKTKTKFSNRGLLIPVGLKEEFLAMKTRELKEKEYRGSDYNDYGLVFTLPEGNPIEPHRCEKWFKSWQRESGLDLPEIVFHEIRHSSATYHLALTGDLKTAQAYTGHASAKVLTDVYAHMQETGKEKFVQALESDFYGQPDITSINEKEIEKDKVATEVPNTSQSSKPSQDEDTLMGQAMLKILEKLMKKDPLLHKKVLEAVLAEQDTVLKC